MNILFEEILRGSDEFIFVIHPKKGLIFDNEKQQLLGYNKEEFQKIKPPELFSKESFVLINDLFTTNRLKKSFLLLELVKKDLSKLKIKATIKPLPYKKTRLLIIRACSEIMEVMGSKIIDPVTFWKNIADSLPDYVSICDTDFNITYVNHSNLVEASSYIGKSALDVANGVPRKVLEKQFNIALSGKKSQIQYFLQLPDGSQKWFQAHYQPLFLNNKIYSILVLIKDISSHKALEEEHQRNEKDFKQIIETASDIVYTCDEQGNFTYLNPVGVKKTGYSEKEIIGKSFTEFIREDYLLATKAFYKHQFDNKSLNSYFEFPLIDKFGNEYWLGQSVQIRVKDNLVLGFQALARDITVRKKIETELLEAKQIAEQSLKTKEHFLSVMSHEIRTPLNAVVGLSNLLIAGKHSNDQKEYLDGLKYSTDNLLSVINDVLDFSKIESGKIHLENIDFNLSNLLKRVQEVTRIAAIKKGLDVDLTVDSTIPNYVKGDPVRLNQILVNLVSNAIKFTDTGTIELIIYNRKETENNVEIQFVVKDTGIGISPNRINYIFEPFTQASSETTRKYGGSGLGLSISNKLIKLMDGKIKVDSKVNKGSTFKVNIQFDKTEQVDNISENEKSISPNFISKNLKILIVEDNEMNQFVIQKTLDNWGIKHEEAYDGEEALSILLKKKFDLILLDLEMPKMDGYQLSKEIRSNEIDTPVIAVSATNNPKSIKLALSNGANDFLSKPIDNKLLISKIIQYTSLDNLIENKKIKSKISPSKNTAHKSINLDYLISSSAGDTSFIEKMINSFIINTPGYLKRLNDFLEKNELENLRTEAHKFKATISIMGVIKGKQLIEKLENAIESNIGLEKIPRYLNEIEKESNLACKELAIILTKSIK